MRKFALVLVCVLAVCGVVSAEDKKIEERDCRSVKVETWLVCVSTDALYESGIQPVPSDDKQEVTILNLIWCLTDPNNGVVISSGQTLAVNHVRAEFRSKKTEYIEVGAPVKSSEATKARHKTSSYQTETYCRTYSRIESDKNIFIEYEWSFEGILTSTSKLLPEPISIGNQSALSIKPGKPVIVNQSHINDKMLFLVMRTKIIE